MKYYKWLAGALVFVMITYGSIGFSADLNLADLNGNEHKLSDYRGQWVVVNYWATWCPPCIEEIPELVLFQAKYQNKGAAVLGVNFEELEVDLVAQFLKDYHVNYPILLSEPEAVTELGFVDSLPTTFIVSPEGNVVVKKIGKIDMAYLERVILEHKRGQKQEQNKKPVLPVRN